jgi:hypothetical protein
MIGILNRANLTCDHRDLEKRESVSWKSPFVRHIFRRLHKREQMHSLYSSGIEYTIEVSVWESVTRWHRTGRWAQR